MKDHKAKRILILSASAGAGHVRAAQALEKVLREDYPDCIVRNVDTLQFTNKLFRSLYSDAYIQMVNRSPALLGWLYDRLDKPLHEDPLRIAVETFNSGRFIKMVKEFKPEIAVCTHFLPSEILSVLKRKGQVDCSIEVVVTDLDVHGMWLCPSASRYFVALEETRQHLIALGIGKSNVEVTGIPIDPIFSQLKDKGEMRQKYGLRPDVFTIIVSAGGFGVGAIEHLGQSLLSLSNPAQVVLLCGKNETLRRKIEQRFPRKSSAGVRIHAVGYTTEMDEYMSAADMMVGKPGGLTTSEALAKGLLLVVVNPIPGQEERNSDHLLEEGAAVRCNNLPVLAWKIDALLSSNKRLARMRRNVARLSRPHAAEHIIRTILA